jgi:hypothetical protein
MSYCPSGDMSSRAFVFFVKDARLLNKKTFTKPDADILFEKAKLGQGGTKTLHFPGFMKIAVPLVAEKIGKPTEVVVARLASVEHKAVRDLDKESSVSVSAKSESSAEQTAEDAAAIRLQAIARKKMAQKQTAAIKQVRS